MSDQPFTTQNTQPYADGIVATTIGLADFDGDGNVEVYCGGSVFAAESGVMLCQVLAGSNDGDNTSYTSYDFAGWVYKIHQMTAAGEYTGRVNVESGCDTIRTLFLQTRKSDSVERVDYFCENHSYTFRGKTLTEAGIYRDTLINTEGCDSILILDLRQKPASYSHLKDSSYSCEAYDFNGKQLMSSGIYRDTITSANGCDSIITLELYVSPKEFSDTLNICRSQLPITVYDTTFQANTQSEVYIIHYSCATITYHLNVASEIGVDRVEIPEICADAPSFSLVVHPTANPDEVLPDRYNLTFDQKSQAAGFTDIAGVLDASNEVSVNTPQNIIPDYYKAKIIFPNSTSDCADVEFSLDLPVFYPKTIMKQMWNDVIALLNERYNGGYLFSDYEWYKNGTLMPNETKSFIYLGEGNVFDLSDRYQAKPTRVSDGVKILSCSLTPTKHTDITQYPTIVGGGDKYRVRAREQLTIRFYNVVGVMVSEVLVPENSEVDIYYPNISGVYIMNVLDHQGHLKESLKVVVR